MFPNNQDESSKHLLARLYKKFDAQKSSKLLVRNQSPKEDKQLVPRIAMRKQLEVLPNQPSAMPITINKGKFLVSPKATNLSQINQSMIPRDQTTFNLNLTTSFSDQKRTNEINPSTGKFDHIKIIDDVNKESRSPKPSPPRISSSPKKKILKKKKSYSIKKKKQATETYKDSSDYLTPIDFIHLIRTDPEMTDEFCYLNKRSHPYDFQIVDFNERRVEEYMTISARGITHFFDGEAVFMTIEEWEREVKMFHRLRQIPYFEKYKIWKNFSLWKKHTRRNIMKDRSKVLSQQLFFLDKHLRRPLLEVRNICLHLTKLEYMDLSNAEPARYEDFRTLQENYRVSLMDQKFDTLEHAIKDLIVNSCQTSLISFKEENRIPNKDPDNPSGDNEEPAPLLVGDETNKEMPYTQEATIRTHYKRLRKFIKLVDYLILNGKLSMMGYSTDSLARSIGEHNLSVKDPKRNARLNCWIICEVGMKEKELTFIPNIDMTRKIFDEVVNKGVQRICNKHKQLIHFPELLTYTRNNDNEEENNEELIDIQTLIYGEDLFKKTIVQLKKELDVAFENVINFAKFLNPYLVNYHENILTKIQEFENKEIDELKQSIYVYKKQDQEFQSIEPKTELGLFLFDNQALKDLIKNSAANCLNDLTRLMPDLVFRKAKTFVETMTELNNKLTWTPNESPMQFVEQFVGFSESVISIAQRMEEYTSLNSEIGSLLYLIIEEKIKIPESYKGKVQEASSQINSLRKKIEEANASYDQNLTKCKRKLEKLIPDMEEKLKELILRVSNSEVASKDADIQKTNDFINEISKEIYDLYDQSQKINHFQRNLQLEETRYEKILTFQSEFVQISKLWTSRKQFRDNILDWSRTHFLKVPLDKMIVYIDKVLKIANECSKELETNEVARIFKQEVEDYKIISESLTSLRDPAIGDKQWVEIREILKDEKGKTLEKLDDPLYTLDYLVKLNFMKYKENLQEIALKAAKEADLIKMLENVESFWKTAFINVQSYKDLKDVSILGNNEDLISKIDDTLLTLNNIMASRFVEGIRAKVELQMKLFRYLQELIDEWILHQRNWIYLEPIFSSQNSHMGLMKEVKSFNTADAQWKKLMKKARELNSAKQWAEDYASKSYFKILRKNNEVFDNIQKALDDYLEKKREHFQRFFFLSSDELLEILSTSKTLHSLQPHLRKVFENIAKLEFDKEVAIAMISAEGESVPLKNCIPRGEVEDWLKTIEDQMRQSLRSVMRQSLLHYEKEETQRKDWVSEYPLQVVITVDSIYWTKITEEEYLSPDSENDIDDWYQINLAQLEELILLIRGKLTQNKRKTLVALVTQDVHYRDIIEQLSNERVESVNDFKWIQQLRFYWGEDHLTARQVNSSLIYGYEYLGATTRLVITPLTDRCWMTITGALHIKLGAQPAGPAGTGKTESCKDLAKALAKYCIVFNCSEQVNVKIMEKLFIGLCYTGSWSCLDEFNRIDIEVLSVIAQQVLTIREALLENKTQFPFFSKNSISLNHNMGIFITMNPGYAGRTELPDNLKVLFRPVSMMVPNYDLIAEIMLFAEGFSEAKELSRKMTKLYKLSSEQLSQQDHYDFGMRAVKSVLVMAGNLKRAEPKTSEEKILIRAMRDSNVPKFLSFDLPLFHSILTDLFPGSSIPELENELLSSSITIVLDVEKLRSSKIFVEKILQLHETLKVRFGVMIVGPTMGGKSTIINVLKNSHSRMREMIDEEITKTGNSNIPNQQDYQNIESMILNPKSISMNELYGELDLLTQTWSDGLASKIMREYVNGEENNKRKWVIFDGPVDSLWIENMNTVLDDSMTLCLSNGERIKLRNDMKMLFEVMDLAVASPATVSRCGMVFVDQDALDYKSIAESYFDINIFPIISKEIAQYLLGMLILNFKKSLPYLRKKCQEPIPTVDNNLITSICKNIRMLLDNEKDRKILESLESNFKKSVDKLFISAFSWGIAGSFQNLEIYEKICNELFNPGDLPKGSIFQYYVGFGKPEGEFISWDSILTEFVYNPKKNYFDLMVQTPDTVCYSWLLENYIKILSPVFLTGVTGTGKTVIVSSTLDRLKENGSISGLKISFSAQTSSLSTQLLIESKLTSQRKQKRIILMPPPGKKLVVFVDDINMPQTEVYGTQPPIQLLRQFQDYKGFYDRKTNVWKEIDSTMLIAAAAPPGGGRSELTPRFTRHFNILCVPNTSFESLSLIFSSILKGFLKEMTFRTEIQELAENSSVVSATLTIYQQISKELLPTPIRSHYTFNLRDVSKIFQGLLMVRSSSIQKVDDFVRLWLHECNRVFGDRLINDSDRQWFLENIMKMVFIFFKLDWKVDDIFSPGTSLIYCDFMKKGIELEKRVYEEVKDFPRFIKVLKEYMNETNLNLVMFKDASEQLSHIARVLRQQRGHFMLVGVGGSGKKSLTILGSILAGCTLKTIEPRKNYGRKEFKEDLLGIMIEVGVKNQSISFMFSDSDILQESFLEDINNLLNSGEVPNLLQKEDIESLNLSLSSEAREKGFPDAYSLFIDKVRNNLHIVLGLSPVGSEFRNRLRKFPSLVNCCTINWLNPWPEEALFTVATMFLENLNYDGVNPTLIKNLSSLCVYVHQNVNIEAENFFTLLRRRVYTTPKSYIDLIESYKELLKLKFNEINSNRNKLTNGLFKLEEANNTIHGLKEKLIKLQPELKQKTLEQEELIKKLDVDRYEATKKRTIVEEEERVVNEKTDKIREMKQEADRILSDAMPILNAATEALNTLNRNDISEIKAQPSPHALVKFTLECVATLLDEKSDWDNIKKILADPNFLSRMKNLKVEGITRQTQDKIKRKIASNPSFIPSEVQKINNAAKSICEWVRAVSEFTDIFKDIEKKRIFVDDMNKELELANSILSKKQYELQEVNKKVNMLEQQYNENKKEKDRLDEEIQKTEARLLRASDLTKGLEDEQIRWRENVGLLGEDLNVLVGNVFLAGASVSYYGPFTGQFRERMVKSWLDKCIELELPVSETYDIQKVLGNPVELREWNGKGLPSDKVSINNGILVKYARSYPLMIDPQSQANRWIKNLFMKDNLKVVKMKADNMIKMVEMCIRMGDPLLIEDVEETLDPMLEPLLLKQFTFVNNRKMVSFGDSGGLEIDDSFKIYFSTKLANPNFLPEIFIRVTVINFTVTYNGLEEQLLAHVVRREMPEIEMVRSELIVSIARDRANLKKNEDRILDLLNDSKGLILDDIDLIKSLQESKSTSEVVKEKLQQAEQKQMEIEIARSQYKGIANRGSILYFVIADLALIDPMYQFSLGYITKLFNAVIEKTPKENNVSNRVQTLMMNITETLFSNVCRGLFNTHKKIFSFLVCAQIQLHVNIIHTFEWQIFLKGAAGFLISESPKLNEKTPTIKGLTDIMWQTILLLKKLGGNWDKLHDSILNDNENWENWLSLEEPHLSPMPEKILTGFQKLLILKIFRMEKTIYGLDIYVEECLNKKFTSSVPATMEEVFSDTDCTTPLIFILSPGADPLMNLLSFAKEKKITNDKLFIISLGQGQGPLAEKAIEKAISLGGWTILQNCHLGKSFMPELEKKLELLENPEFLANINQELFQKFRLFLTSMPCNYFPVSVLQNGMKLTNEPPKGIKANISKSFNEMTSERFETCAKEVPWKKLLYSLSFFHAVIQERRKFGPLGWNILYEFNDSDLETSLTMLHIMLENYTDIPWDALNYMTGEINYGGRVTDEWDRRCLLSILNRFLNDDVLGANYSFSESAIYKGFPDGNLQDCFDLIRIMPDIEKPEIFGMHENANISYQIKESNIVLDCILAIQPRETANKEKEFSPDKMVEDLCLSIENRLPILLKKDASRENKEKKDYIDSIEICLIQECERFNKLLIKIKGSIIQLIKAIKGEDVMSAELDTMYQRLFNNQVPEIWTKFAYPSLKPLAQWFEDLLQRTIFFKNWLDNDKPISYWLSAFFFPQGFLTSVLQNYARKFKLAVDLLGFSFKFCHFSEVEKIVQVPQEGVYIHGLFVEGCKFDMNKGTLEDSEKGVMFTQAPIINFIPTENYQADEKDYSMPVYKTTVRAGTLSTTGHSTNFIIAIDCNSKKKPEYWILNGAAFTCAINN